jgi:hypothetical protein
MKFKIAVLIGLILGMILHKSLNYIYDYSFNAAFDGPKCHDIMLNGGNLSDRFTCTHREMGLIDDLQYLLLRPTAPNGIDKDSWTF